MKIPRALQLLFLNVLLSVALHSAELASLAWTEGYKDCYGKPLALFLELGPFDLADTVDIRNIVPRDEFSERRRQFLAEYPKCRITPILEFLFAVQWKYLDDHDMNSGDPFRKNIVRSFRKIADEYPNVAMPFDLSTDNDIYRTGTLIAPAALMCIADLRSRASADASASLAAEWTDEASKAWTEVLKRFPRAKSGSDQTFSVKALAKLLTYYGCLLGSFSTCTIQSAKTKEVGLIALEQYPNAEYNDGHYCGTLHSHALFAMAEAESNLEKACGYLKEIIHKHADEGFFACDTDAGGAVGYSALEEIKTRCGTPQACIKHFQELAQDPSVPHDWRGRAQYNVAVAYQADLMDYRQAIKEYKILAEHFGDVVLDDESDESDQPQNTLGTIARERIQSLEAYLKK
jgi:hypothetical protein